MSFGATTYSHFAAVGRRDWLIDVTTTANITNGPISNLVDGLKANNNDAGVFCNSAESGREFKFTFPWQVRIDEFTWTQDAAGTQGTWKFAGSNDDSTYTDLATGLNLGGAAAADVHAFTNTNGYRYYKLIQTAGTTTNSRWIQEIEFKLSLDSAYPAGGGALGATSYSNQDGSGNRSARMLMLLDVATACGGTDVGNMNSMLNGVAGVNNCTDGTAFPNAGASHYITIYFRDPLVIDEFTWKQQNANTQGTWKIQGSHDNSTFTDIATGLTFGNTATEAVPFTNTVAYNFYRLVQTSGNLNYNPWLHEIEFKTSLAAAPAETPHNFAAGVALEVLNDGAGSNATVAGVALEVLNNSDGSTAFASGVAVEILSSVALAPQRAFSGGKIYEWQFAFQPESIYSESDWDSIYSIGDRTGNGTLTWSQAGWASTTGDVNQLGDYNWGLSGGNGFGVGGQTGWPAGAYWAWSTNDGSFQYISGFRLFGLFGLGGYFTMFGGYDHKVWAINTLEFEQFGYGGGAPPQGAYYEFTPPFFPFNYWSMTLASLDEGDDSNFPGGGPGPELMFKVYHSVLDGGDRRPTNGRAIKRVTVSVSSGIEAHCSDNTVDPMLNLIDGQYFGSNGGPNPPTGKSKSTSLLRVGWTSGDEAILNSGEYIQFGFPRKVFMREMVWNVGGQEILDSGGNPTVYGTWQWQASNASGSGYVNVGDPWHFSPGTGWMKSPKPINEADPATPYQDYLYPYWRMVLVEGPAFGGGTEGNIAQIQFNLIDPNNQDPINEIQFSDDQDGLLPTINITAGGSPSELKFTDGDSDVLTATITIVNNPVLSATFSDGQGDGLNEWGSFYPTRFSQTMVVIKGR